MLIPLGTFYLGLELRKEAACPVLHKTSLGTGDPRDGLLPNLHVGVLHPMSQCILSAHQKSLHVINSACVVFHTEGWLCSGILHSMVLSCLLSLTTQSVKQRPSQLKQSYHTLRDYFLHFPTHVLSM